MNAETLPEKASGAAMGVFERYLTAWVFLCILVGIGLGQLFPDMFHAPSAPWK